MSLPIDAIREATLSALEYTSVVITAPTGTGKSTQVPRWLLGAEVVPGKVAAGKRPFLLVIQPRRVACRAVAQRIAELEGETLGRRIGYRVRDDDCSSPETELLVVTPGIVLSKPELLSTADVVVLDELHERRLDTDLILALLVQAQRRYVAMSATLDGEAVASKIGALHLSVEARTFPVDVSYQLAGGELPDPRDVEKLVVRAVIQCGQVTGSILVFLPGKGEIARLERALSAMDREVLALHGGLSLREQSRVLGDIGRPRVILATNVAETSLTIPGVTVVIDSGLVRKTTYHGGRSYLALAPIAFDSAEQRAGRAGRTAPGACIRLWGRQAKLEARTAPEVFRESLVPLVMTCAALKTRPESLPFLDAPKDYALKDARVRLVELGALALGEGEHQVDLLTPLGESLRGIPLDPGLSRILVEARSRGCLPDAIDLVAALEQSMASQIAQSAADELILEPTCDLSALLCAMRDARLPESGVLQEARTSARRLRRAFGLGKALENEAGQPTFDRPRLLKAILAADPSSAHVARTRKQKTAFSSGGTELELARESRAKRAAEPDDPRARAADAVIVLATRGMVVGAERRLLITLASPVPLRWLAEAGLGTVRVEEATLAKKGSDKGKLLVGLERSYAGRVIERTEQEPRGEVARQAIVKLFCEGRLDAKRLQAAKSRLARRELAAQLGRKPEFPYFAQCISPPELALWLGLRLAELGVEGAEDLELLSAADWLPDDIPAELAPQFDERFPDRVDVGDCIYSVAYDLEKRQVMLSILRGHRQAPPPANYLPKFEGLRVFVEAGGVFHPLRR